MNSKNRAEFIFHLCDAATTGVAWLSVGFAKKDWIMNPALKDLRYRVKVPKMQRAQPRHSIGGIMIGGFRLIKGEIHFSPNRCSNHAGCRAIGEKGGNPPVTYKNWQLNPIISVCSDRRPPFLYRAWAPPMPLPLYNAVKG